MLARRLGIETEKVPAALWVYVTVSMVWGLVATAIQAGSDPAWIAFVPFLFLFSLLILRRSRIVWGLTVFGEAVTLLTLPVSPSPWWVVVSAVFGLCVMLSPPVWRFVWRDRPDSFTPQQVTSDLSVYADSERRDGWYVDPENPMRMRYWSNAANEWLGSTKTPRKIRESWRAEGGN